MINLKTWRPRWCSNQNTIEKTPASVSNNVCILRLHRNACRCICWEDNAIKTTRKYRQPLWFSRTSKCFTGFLCAAKSREVKANGNDSLCSVFRQEADFENYCLPPYDNSINCHAAGWRRCELSINTRFMVNPLSWYRLGSIEKGHNLSLKTLRVREIQKVEVKLL